MAKKQKPPTRWKNQIVGHADVTPGDLLANPQNWRIHAALQQQTMQSVLDEVGWVRAVLVNRRTDHVVDGHMRVLIADRNEEPTVPVDYIDVDLDTERKILATLDPIAAMAGTDSEKLAELMDDIHAKASEALKTVLSEIKKPVHFMARAEPKTKTASGTFGVVVTCATPAEEIVLMQRFNAEGLTCRAVSKD